MYNTTYESIVSNETEINFSSKHTKFWKNKKVVQKERKKLISVYRFLILKFQVQIKFKLLHF